MFRPHVIHELVAYCHGELAEPRRRRVEQHLRQCARCRDEYEALQLGDRLARRLPRAAAPDRVWLRVEAALAEELERSRRESPSADTKRFPGLWGPPAWALGAMVLLVIMLAWMAPQPPRTVAPPRGPVWEVARVAGAPVVGSDRIRTLGQLKVGQALETDGTSRARVQNADVGDVEVEPNTRLRLLTSGAQEHRLALDRGAIHAMISAPPRLFFVQTPSALAVDLGCSYTLTVDDRGRSRLLVTSGWVALVRDGRESEVPAGAECLTQPGIGPGTPHFEDAPPALRQALEQLDFANGGPAALHTVLTTARRRDTLTLWHLLPRTSGAERVQVYNRLAQFVPPPAPVTRQDILALRQPQLDRWKYELESDWLE